MSLPTDAITTPSSIANSTNSEPGIDTLVGGQGVIYPDFSGTFSFDGDLCAVFLVGTSDITVLPDGSLPTNNRYFLEATSSIVNDTQGTGDTIHGHGTETIFLGNSALLSLGGGKNDTVTVNSSDQVILTTTGTDTININGTHNNVWLGGAVTGAANTFISNGSTGNTVYLRDNTTYVVDDNGGNNTYHLGSGSIAVNGTASDTFFAMELGNHTITLPVGNSMIIARDGTIPGHNDAITINGFSDGHDTVELSGGAAIAHSSAAVFTHLTDGAHGAVLTLGSETITFAGVNVSQLHTGDFIIS